jgi:hypothetical protein
MSTRKFAGRYVGPAVMNGTDPHDEGSAKETDAAMATHGVRPLRANALTRFRQAPAVLVAATALMLLCGVGAARAGEWEQVSCVNPNQTAAGSDGWVSVIAGGGYGSNSSTACGPGSPMFAILSTDAAVGVSSAETLRYIPPAGSNLIGGNVDVGLHADGRGYNASGTAVLYTPEYAYNASNVFFQCASGLTPCAPGSNDFTGVLGIPAGRRGNLYLSAGCGGAPGASCNEGGSNGAWSLVQLWWANVRLSNGSAPAASGVGGTLLEAGARGSQELALTAADPSGPGVYEVTVQADGQTLYSGTPDSNGGHCVAVGKDGAALMFDSSQPCKQSESVDEPIDTTPLHDGQHALKVTVADAAQNASVVYDATISTHNAPANASAPSLVTSGQLLPGSTLSAQRGEWTAPSGTGAIAYGYEWEDCDGLGNNCQSIPGAQGSSYTPTAAEAGHTLRVVEGATDSDGASKIASAASAIVGSAAAPSVPNGAGASHVAQLQLTGRPAISRPFAHRAFTITGQLVDGAGKPISGASLDVREQLQGSGAVSVIAFAQTGPNGTFAERVPAGPSRRILLGYRAFSGDAAYSAQAGRQEAVTAGVHLSVTPRSTGSQGSIVLAGHVSGPVPRNGVVVELLVHYRGRWEPFREPRADAHGHFHTRYHFEGGVGRFPFRAEVLGGQSGFPYATGQSAAVEVSTR